jgi:hypothetical protein
MLVDVSVLLLAYAVGAPPAPKSLYLSDDRDEYDHDDDDDDGDDDDDDSNDNGNPSRDNSTGHRPPSRATVRQAECPVAFMRLGNISTVAIQLSASAAHTLIHVASSTSTASRERSS